MYGLYDKEGILRFVDSDKDACIAYAELFELSLIHISEPTRPLYISYAVFCLKKNLGL